MEFENIINILGSNRKKIGRYVFSVYKNGEITVSTYNYEVMQPEFVKEMNDKFNSNISNRVLYVHDGPILDDVITNDLNSFGPSAIFLVDRMFLHSVEQLEFAINFAKTKGHPSNVA